MAEAKRDKDDAMAIFTKFFAALTAVVLLATGAAAQDGYRITAGDVLRIEVLEDPNLNRSSLVTPDGQVAVPLAGTVRASGRTVAQVRTDVAAKLAVNFANPPTVFVAVESLGAATAGPATPATIDIYLVGEANKPGMLSVAPGTTLLQMIGEMGGFTKFAAKKRVQLRRTDRKSGKETVYQFSYPDIVAGTSAGGNTVLRDGDVILIPQRRLFE